MGIGSGGWMGCSAGAGVVLVLVNSSPGLIPGLEHSPVFKPDSYALLLESKPLHVIHLPRSLWASR